MEANLPLVHSFQENQATSAHIRCSSRIVPEGVKHYRAARRPVVRDFMMEEITEDLEYLEEEYYEDEDSR